MQRSLLTRYHISDAHAFYAGTDYWKVPDDPTKNGSLAQPPYYLTLARPGQTTPSFQLTTSLLQNNGRNMAAFVMADSDPTSSTYGKLFTLQLPSDALVDGPGIVHNNFRAFPAASTEISLLDQHGSTVDEGNLLTLPLGGGFVYVEPLYVRSASVSSSFPKLERVLVDFNGTVAYQPTLQQALDVAFGAAGATSPPPSSASPPPSSGGGTSATIASLISALATAQADADAALRRGDLAGYATAEKKVSSLIAQLSAANKKAPSPSPSASPSPSPSGTR